MSSARARAPPAPPPPAMSLAPAPDPLAHVALVQGALARAACRVRAAAEALPPTAPDADLAALAREADALVCAVRAHAGALRTEVLGSIARRARPAKRARTGGVVEVQEVGGRLVDEARVATGGDVGDRERAVGAVRGLGAALGEAVVRFVDGERGVLGGVGEEDGLPRLLVGYVKRLLCGVEAHVLRLLAVEDLLALFATMDVYASADELAEVAATVVRGVPRAVWERVCGVLPRLRKLAPIRDNPLVEITYLHKAIRKELEDLVTFCRDVDVSDDLQLQNIAKRLAFLRKVHSFHSEGEDNVLLKELHTRLTASCADTPADPAKLLYVHASPALSSVGEEPDAPDADREGRGGNSGGGGAEDAGAGVRAARAGRAPAPAPTPPDPPVGDAVTPNLGDSPRCGSIGTPDPSAGHLVLHEEHTDEVRLFDSVMAHVTQLRAQLVVAADGRAARTHVPPVDVRRKSLIARVRSIAVSLIQHMDKEETRLLPLVREHFTVADQDNMMRRVMARVPSAFLPDLIPWVVHALPVADQENLLRNVLRTASPQEFHRIAAAPLQAAVADGMHDRAVWDELYARVPELRAAMPDASLRALDPAEGGPVSEVLRVHKAIRVELHALLRAAAVIPEFAPNPRSLQSFAERVSFLRRMVNEHSKAEDLVLLPRLEERSPGVSARYSSDHSDERALFNRLSQLLEEMQCANDAQDCANLVRRLRVVIRTLRDEMVDHLRMEEDHLWPILTSNFSKAEQAEIVARIFGLMPSAHFRELLPWMIRVLSVSEQAAMMTHILQVTKSTMFEKWLSSWFPHFPGASDDGNESGGDQSSKTPDAAGAGPGDGKAAAGDRNGASAEGSGGDETASAAAALVLLRGRDNVVLAIREIAKDESLSLQARSRMMQQIMLAPWSQKEGRAGSSSTGRAAHGGSGSGAFHGAGSKCGRGFSKRDRGPSYRDASRKAFGCTHYARSCKLVAECCKKIYTCRLCHDSAEDHVMDRTATRQMVCMICSLVQPVGKQCAAASCRKPMASYFCEECKFFDDDPSRHIYHCQFCSVCRAGRGLGIDYFHCMKCNQCMSMKFRNNHVCVERAMESDCPVCHQYLFASTTPVKYLRCGHLMHVACKKVYTDKGHINCPICMKSLEDMTTVFKKLDHLLMGESMPREYRTARCDMFCLDCNTASNVPYHFLYVKCPNCNSYNTRVDHVDANAGDTDTPVAARPKDTSN